MSRPNTMLGYALEYLDRGIPVFPAREKKPLVKWASLQDRLPLEDEVRQWWSVTPDAQIAAATGLLWGVIVLDLDGPEGLESVRGLRIPRTPTSQTGKGRHLFFRHPGLDDGEQIRNFARRNPGVDLRGDGGYVILPPSFHSLDEEGNPRHYAWEIGLAEIDPAPVPPWLLEWVRNPDVQTRGKRKRGPSTGEEEIDGVSWYTRLLAFGADEGERNTATARLAGYLLAKGLDEDTALYQILAWNTAKNRPPLDEDEVEKTVRSIAKAERRKRDPSKLDEESYTVADRRRAARETASEALGFSIEQVVRYGATPGVYEILAQGQRIRLGGIEDLIEYRRFRRRIADALGVLVKISSKEFPGVAEFLLAAVEEVDLDEATDLGQALYWIRDYLENYDPTAVEEWKEAAYNSRPFVKDGATYLSLPGLKRYVTSAIGDKITTPDLAVALRRLGLKDETIGVSLSGKQTTRSVWKLPGHVLGEVPTGNLPPVHTEE